MYSRPDRLLKPVRSKLTKWVDTHNLSDLRVYEDSLTLFNFGKNGGKRSFVYTYKEACGNTLQDK